MNEGIGGWAGLFGALLLLGVLVPSLLILGFGLLKMAVGEEFFDPNSRY